MSEATELGNQTAQALRDPATLPLEKLDVSDPELFEHDTWQGFFARLREEDPVHYQADSPFGPFWSITKFDDIQYVDKHHEIFSSEPTVLLGDQPEDFTFVNFIQSDPPIHDEQRKAVQDVVAPRNLAELEPIIRSRVQTILDGLPVGETFNWVDRVSIELTTQMLATLFDFPFEERRKLTHWSDVAIATPELTGSDSMTEEQRRAEMMECYEYFHRLWKERENQPPKFDLISMLIHGESTKDIINKPMEYLGNLLLLIIGGNDTTRNSISGGVVALNQNPAEYEKLRNNPGLIPNMVSEIIRWQTPLSHMRRTAKVDTELGGKQIRKGEKVVMWYVSGNRDGDAIDRPDEFIIDRPKARHHLSFGFGIHRCMGNRLAEMQLRIVWEEILKRFHSVELVGEPVRVRSNFVKGYAELPVRVHPVN
ncbi:MAG: cytochrome P450 [Gammaproteobacteria bacterium]|nr:MAG: cytochrome P450 [Gammaproteobacteria bacterium]